MKPVSAAPICPACGYRIVVVRDRFVGHYSAPGAVGEGAAPCSGSYALAVHDDLCNSHQEGGSCDCDKGEA